MPPRGEHGNLDAVAIYDLQREVKRLREVVIQLLRGSLEGVEVNLDTPEIRQLLHLPEGSDTEEIAAALRESHAPVSGKTTCSECGSVTITRDTDAEQRCQFCGAGLHAIAGESLLDETEDHETFEFPPIDELI